MYKVPQQQSSIGQSQQTVSKQETEETKVDVVKPTDSGEDTSQASNSEDGRKNCSVEESEQQNKTQAVSLHLWSCCAFPVADFSLLT